MRLLFGLSKLEDTAPVEVAGKFPSSCPWISGAAILMIGIGLIAYSVTSGRINGSSLMQGVIGLFLTTIGGIFIGVLRSVKHMTSLEQVASAYDVDVETARQSLVEAGLRPKVVVNGTEYYKLAVGRDPAQLLRPSDNSKELLRPSTSANADALLRPLPQENLSRQEQST